MAARKHLSHSDKTRERIKTSMLINRLQSFVEGTVELTAPQVTAALGLIKKTLPDLQAIEHSGAVETSLSPEMQAWLGRR
jgi:hypothetical protein